MLAELIRMTITFVMSNYSLSFFVLGLIVSVCGREASPCPKIGPRPRLPQTFHPVELFDPVRPIGHVNEAVEQITGRKVLHGQRIIGRSCAFLIGPSVSIGLQKLDTMT
jgi:hypothetical protein